MASEATENDLQKLGRFIRVGHDLLEDFCVHDDFEGARDVIEKTLLPTTQALSLVSWVVPVRS